MCKLCEMRSILSGIGQPEAAEKVLAIANEIGRNLMAVLEVTHAAQSRADLRGNDVFTENEKEVFAAAEEALGVGAVTVEGLDGILSAMFGGSDNPQAVKVELRDGESVSDGIRRGIEEFKQKRKGGKTASEAMRDMATKPVGEKAMTRDEVSKMVAEQLARIIRRN